MIQPYYYSDEAFAIGLLLALLGIYFVAFVIGIISYVLSSISLHTIARRRQISNPWLAWIPCANYWIIGKIADDYDRKNGMNRKWGTLLFTLSLIGITTFIVSFVAFFVVAILAAIKSGIYESEDIASEYVLSFLMLYIVLLLSAVVMSLTQFLGAICIYKIFESTAPQKAVKYIILYLLIPLGGAICLFICRNQGYSNPEPPLQAQYISQADITQQP